MCFRANHPQPFRQRPKSKATNGKSSNPVHGEQVVRHSPKKWKKAPPCANQKSFSAKENFCLEFWTKISMVPLNILWSTHSLNCTEELIPENCCQLSQSCSQIFFIRRVSLWVSLLYKHFIFMQAHILPEFQILLIPLSAHTVQFQREPKQVTRPNPN